MVLLRDIHFVSHCEHHIAPIIGRAHIAYFPRNRVVGISKLARLVEIYAKRLQIQERMTTEIARALDRALKPHGVAVAVEAAHGCMTTRGVHQHDVKMVTRHLIGAFGTSRRPARNSCQRSGCTPDRATVDRLHVNTFAST